MILIDVHPLFALVGLALFGLAAYALFRPATPLAVRATVAVLLLAAAPGFGPVTFLVAVMVCAVAAGIAAWPRAD